MWEEYCKAVNTYSVTSSSGDTKMTLPTRSSLPSHLFNALIMKNSGKSNNITTYANLVIWNVFYYFNNWYQDFPWRGTYLWINNTISSCGVDESCDLGGGLGTETSASEKKEPSFLLDRERAAMWQERQGRGPELASGRWRVRPCLENTHVFPWPALPSGSLSGRSRSSLLSQGPLSDPFPGTTWPHFYRRP